METKSVQTTPSIGIDTNTIFAIFDFGQQQKTSPKNFKNVKKNFKHTTLNKNIGQSH